MLRNITEMETVLRLEILGFEFNIQIHRETGRLLLKVDKDDFATKLGPIQDYLLKDNLFDIEDIAFRLKKLIVIESLKKVCVKGKMHISRQTTLNNDLELRTVIDYFFSPPMAQRGNQQIKFDCHFFIKLGKLRTFEDIQMTISIRVTVVNEEKQIWNTQYPEKIGLKSDVLETLGDLRKLKRSFENYFKVVKLNTMAYQELASIEMDMPGPPDQNHPLKHQFSFVSKSQRINLTDRFMRPFRSERGEYLIKPDIELSVADLLQCKFKVKPAFEGKFKTLLNDSFVNNMNYRFFKRDIKDAANFRYEMVTDSSIYIKYLKGNNYLKLLKLDLERLIKVLNIKDQVSREFMVNMFTFSSIGISFPLYQKAPIQQYAHGGSIVNPQQDPHNYGVVKYYQYEQKERAYIHPLMFSARYFDEDLERSEYYHLSSNIKLTASLFQNVYNPFSNFCRKEYELRAKHKNLIFNVIPENPYYFSLIVRNAGYTTALANRIELHFYVDVPEASVVFTCDIRKFKKHQEFFQQLKNDARYNKLDFVGSFNGVQCYKLKFASSTSRVLDGRGIPENRPTLLDFVADAEKHLDVILGTMKNCEML
jgi:hypothetical protein